MPRGIFKNGNKGIFTKGCIPWNKSKKLPQITGDNHWNKGKNWNWTDEQKEKLKGKKTGKNNGRWINDRTNLSQNEYKHLDYKYRNWMFAVKKRDNWKCKINNSDCKGRLESHHILNWKNYPELRYEISNGITLCHSHHPRGRENEAKLSPYLKQLVAEMK